MLRECIRYEALTKILLYSDNFFDFFKYVEVSTFDIASDAFATFKVSIKLYFINMTQVSSLISFLNTASGRFWANITIPCEMKSFKISLAYLAALPILSSNIER